MGSHAGNLGYIPFFIPLIQNLQAMRAGILSVARKALDGCSLMNTLATQVAADLGYATEVGQKSLAGKTNLVFVRKRTNGGKNCVPTKRSKKDPSGGENLEFHSGTRSKSFPLKFGKIFICQFVSGFWAIQTLLTSASYLNIPQHLRHGNRQEVTIFRSTTQDPMSQAHRT